MSTPRFHEVVGLRYELLRVDRVRGEAIYRSVDRSCAYVTVKLELPVHRQPYAVPCIDQCGGDALVDWSRRVSLKCSNCRGDPAATGVAPRADTAVAQGTSAAEIPAAVSGQPRDAFAHGPQGGLF